jgi:hypothetical protein
MPSATLMPEMTTLKETTLGKGASPPDTKIVPDCGCTVCMVVFPAPHPAAKIISGSTINPLNHFLEFIAFCPFLLEYPGGAPSTHRPLPI